MSEYTDPSDVDGENITPESVSTDQGTITSLDGTDLQYNTVGINNPTTMFVRSTGSDTNDGLSSGSPKATIQDAIDSASVAQYSDWVVIDLQESATFTESLDIEPYHPNVKLLGDGEGNTTIDDDADNVIDVRGTRLVLDSITVDGQGAGGASHLRVTRNAVVMLKSATVSNFVSSGRAMLAADGGHINVDPNSTIDQTGIDAEAISTQFGATLRFQGTATGSPTSVLFSFEEGAAGVFSGATLTGGGSGTTDRLVDLAENSYAKVAGNCTVENADAIVYITNLGGVGLPTGHTENDINRRYKKATSGSGLVYDADDNGPAFFVPSVDTLPAPTGLGTGTHEGLMAMDRTSDLLKYYHRGNDAWLPLGTRLITGISPADIDARELAFDTTNHALSYKDSGGNLYQKRMGTVIKDETITLPSGGVEEIQLTTSAEYVGTDINVTATPANDPGNNHGYSVDAVFFSDAANSIKVRISETESAGGGDARVVITKRGV